MNWKEIKKMKGKWVKLFPKPLLQDPTKNRIEQDYLWQIQEVKGNKCLLHNTPYDYTFELPKEHIKEYKEGTNQAENGIKHDLFILRSQVVIEQIYGYQTREKITKRIFLEPL